MKAAAYAKTYFSQENGKLIDQDGFLKQLSIEFNESIENAKQKGEVTKEVFDQCLTDIRSRWDMISLKIKGQLSNKLWKYFYVIHVCPVRDQLFPEIAKQVREKFGDESYKASRSKSDINPVKRGLDRLRVSGSEVDIEKILKVFGAKKYTVRELSYRKGLIFSKFNKDLTDDDFKFLNYLYDKLIEGLENNIDNK